MKIATKKNWAIGKKKIIQACLEYYFLPTYQFSAKSVSDNDVTGSGGEGPNLPTMFLSLSVRPKKSYGGRQPPLPHWGAGAPPLDFLGRIEK